MNGKMNEGEKTLLGACLRRAIHLSLLIVVMTNFYVRKCGGVSYFTTSNAGSETPQHQALYYSLSTPAAAVPALFDGDSFDGWVFFNSGLTIPPAANITLNTVGIIGGVLCFDNQNSTLTLGQDLRCRSDFSMTGSAGFKINGNGNALELSGDLTITTSITNAGTLTIDGHGSRLKLLGDDELSVSTGNNLTLKNMDLIFLSSTPIASSGTGKLYLENVNIYLGSNVTIGAAIEYSGLVTINGNGFAFGTGGENTIDGNSVLYVGAGVIFQPQLSNNITLSSASSILALDGCTLDMSTYRLDISLTKGMVTFSNQVFISAHLQTLTIGDGTSSSNDVRVEVNGGAYVIVDGTLYHHPA